jgi:hypothetical protein
MKHARATPGLAVLALSGALSCVPNLSNTDSVVTAPRILAVVSQPAEAPPGAKVTFTALVASPGGTQASAPITWGFCEAPTPLTTDEPVSNACLDTSSLVHAGSGETITAATPSNGCSTFGPDTPPGGFRPHDPDVTGGYYQPLGAVLTGSDATFELARIRCDLANAPSAIVSQFAAEYHVNQNPVLSPLTATIDGAEAPFTSVHAGAQVAFTASWPASSAETFAYYDPSTVTLTTQRESLQVAWYATDGSFATESTGRASNDVATTTEDTWTAPSTAETVHLWIVLRDSRGGVDFAAYDVNVVE